jgi:hypothetical protein
MTYEDEPQPRRATVGAKVLIFGFAIFATLGAFWSVVWFIRSYVEQPRIALRAPMTLASRESEPAPAPREPVATAVAALGEPTAPPAVPANADPVAPTAPARTRRPGSPAANAPAATAQAATPAQQPDPAPAGGAIADRWFPTTQWPDPPNNAAPMTAAAPPAGTEQPAAADETDPAVSEVVAVMEPAISGPIPKPRPKPPVNSVSARLREPPLPRPRPDGPAPQSVWTATPVTDDRFPAASQ